MRTWAPKSDTQKSIRNRKEENCKYQFNKEYANLRSRSVV